MSIEAEWPIRVTGCLPINAMFRKNYRQKGLCMKLSVTSQAALSTAPAHKEKLRQATTRLEASFLSEMMKAAGLGQTRDAFGGGIGEEQFTSFLTESYADSMARRGGIGLADNLYEFMLRGQTEATK